MFRVKQMAGAGCTLLLMSGTLCAQPAFTADDHGQFRHGETSRAPFAGATFRLEIGRGARPPSTRLQIGVRSLSNGPPSEAAPQITYVPLLELGVSGKEGGNLLIAGQPATGFGRRLGLNGDAYTIGSVIFGVTLVAVGALVLLQ